MTHPAADIFMRALLGEDCEHVMAVYLDGAGAHMGTERLASGGLCGCALAPSTVVAAAQRAGAAAVVLGHNHPSGDPTPSPEDVLLTQVIKRALAAVGIELVEHVVVAPATGGTASIK